MDYLGRAAKVAAVGAIATLVAWWLMHHLYTLIDQATEADAGLNPLAPVPFYWGANAVGIVCQPLLLWAGARVTGVRGNHLTVVVSTYVWTTQTFGHLVDFNPGPSEAVLWLAVQSAAATGASLSQVKLMPSSTRSRRERSS